MPRLFSYVVDHDHGYAPNPFYGMCSLAKCKFGTNKRNITELAEEGDWIAGTGGAKAKVSTGHGTLVYAMRVDEKIPLGQYCRANWPRRVDAKPDCPVKGRFALVSEHFFYFGRNAIEISEIPNRHLDHPFEKRGPGYRRDFSEEFVKDFEAWLQETFSAGVHGEPCDPHPRLGTLKCSKKVRRKRKSGC